MIRLAFFIAGLVLLIYLVLQLGVNNVLSVVLSLRWNLAGVTLIYGASEMIRGAALWKSLPEGESQPYLKMFGIYLSGEATRYLTFTGPFVGEPLKAWLLRKKGLPVPSAFAAVITEFLIYTLVAAGMSIVGLSYILRHAHIGAEIAVAARVIIDVMACFISVAAAAIAFRIYLIGNVVHAIRKLPFVGKRVHWERAGVRQMEDLLFQVFRGCPQQFATILALDIAAHTLLVVELYWIVNSSSVALHTFEAFVIEAATKFISLGFFFVPMQVGVAEKTYAITFSTLGLPLAVAIAVSLVRRIRTIVVSIAGLMILTRMTRNFSSTLNSDRVHRKRRA